MDQESNGVKRPYTKPDIKQVALRPDEAVLGACKATSGGGNGPGSGNCRTPSPCSSLGS